MSQMEKRVFVVNDAGHNYDSVGKWGKVIAITQGNINIFRPDRSIYNITQFLQNHKYSCKDYLLLSGNSFGNVFTVLSICHKCNVNKLNLLVYNSKRQYYVAHTFDVKTFKFTHTNMKP